MGMDASIAFEIARSVKQWGLRGSVCTLGVVSFRSSADDLDRAIRAAGIEPQPGGDPFVRMGFRSVESVDVSGSEGCTHILDLNSSDLPDVLRGRFDLIYDGGTLEHVFDVRAAQRNKFEMLRPGGVIIDFLPVNGWVDHGFYQFSPTFFADYYAENGFVLLDARLMKYEPSRVSATVYPYVPGSLNDVPDGSFPGSWLYYGVVRKTESSTCHRIPLQRRYAEIHGGAAPCNDAGLQYFLPYQIVRGAPRQIPLIRMELKVWRRGEGHELLAHLPALAPLSDDAGSRCSPLLLLENGRVIGPSHACHERIRHVGRGAYSHWGEWLHFSTSDNLPPEGRIYEWAIPADVAQASGIKNRLSATYEPSYTGDRVFDRLRSLARRGRSSRR